MAGEGLDLKTLMEHDLRMVQSILDTSRKLVLELETTHYWTTNSAEIFNSLSNICTNINAMLDVCLPEWQSGHGHTGKPEEFKLWQTAAGLYRALPKELKRFNEQITRRRRQRIMGEDTVEDLEIEPEVRESDDRRYKELGEKLDGMVNTLLSRLGELPSGLTPPEQPAEDDPEPAAQATRAETPDQPAELPDEPELSAEDASAAESPL